MEISKTIIIDINENVCKNAAEQLYTYYGLEFDKDQVICAVLNEVLTENEDADDWIDVITPEQAKWIIETTEKAFKAYIMNVCNTIWTGIKNSTI